MVVGSVAALAVVGVIVHQDRMVPDRVPGTVLDSFRGVPVYEHGPAVTASYGKHFAAGGYYFGQKWQCVEFVKRCYCDAKGHRMPSVWGQAMDFFDSEVEHGAVNEQRGLRQFRNGGADCPQVDDLLVFRTGSLGHVAIVSRVEAEEIEVVQQNSLGHPRARHPLTVRDGRYTVGGGKRPAGWLLLP